MNFLKKGKQVHDSFTQEEKEREQKKQAAGSPYYNRFWIPEDVTTKITFLDGKLDEDGLLMTVSYWEHQVKQNGSWQNWFVCISESEPCPLCSDGLKSSLVSLFTVIDHSEFKDKKDEVRSHERKLYVAKGDTFKRLQKKAKNNNGLIGCTFEVSRIGDKSASVGTDFEMLEKVNYKEFVQKYGLKQNGEEDDRKVARPYNYEGVIPYKDAEALKEIGFGMTMYSVGEETVNNQLENKSSPADDFVDDDIPF